MKPTSSIKVGFLTLSAIIILLFTVMWIKGRALSTGERIEIQFHDVNGMRAGSAVQMMGLRVGQVEDIVPIINGENSYVKLRFVITENGIKIPNASIISIQQSGIIGEQFIEITPPPIHTLYLPETKTANILQPEDKVVMKLSGKNQTVGKVLNVEHIDSSYIPLEEKSDITTPKAYKISYIYTLPGLILREEVAGKISSNSLHLSLANGKALEKPQTSSPYTVIEPMRIKDFLDAQYVAAESLADVNNKLNKILSDENVNELQKSIKNINELTVKASSTLEKAQLLVENSKNDIEILLKQSEKLVSKLIILSDNANELIGDDELKNSVVSAATSLDKLSKNVSSLIEDEQTEEILANINEISKNLSEISQFVNTTTKDPTFKKNVNTSISNINKTLEQVNKCLENMDTSQKAQFNATVSDIVVTTRNLRQFSEKLNKRFLLFRLMF